MKRNFWFIAALAICVSAGGWGQNAGLPPVAKVGDVVISGEEFQRNMELGMKQIEVERGAKVTPDTRFRVAVLNDLINAKVLKMMAENAKIEVSDAELEEEFTRRKDSMPSDAAYNEYLQREGLTESQLKEKLLDRLRTEKFIEEKTKDIVISDEQVRAEYETWLAEGKLDRNAKTADFAHILIRPKGEGYEGWNQAQQEIQAARNRILAGEPFEEVAKEVSQDIVSAHRGGAYFEATPEVVSPDFADRLFTLPVGEVSEPFRGRSGWHIMKVLSHNEPGKVSYEKVKEELREGMLAQARKKHLSELVKGARAVMAIELYKTEHFTGEESLDEPTEEGAADGSAS